MTTGSSAKRGDDLICRRHCVNRPRRGYAVVTQRQGDVVATPDHVENTGDNLRHAAEVQKQARDDEAEGKMLPEQSASEPPLPDFNT
jgi:hypothetical protein